MSSWRVAAWATAGLAVLAVSGLPTVAAARKAPRARFSPPGPCVPLSNVVWTAYVTIRQPSPVDVALPSERHGMEIVATAPLPDLDGDGQPEALVPEPQGDDCPGDAHFAVYVTRGSCGHRVGVVHGGIDHTALAGAHVSAGLRELTVTTERQEQPDPRVPAQLRRTTRVYRFDGTSYREVGQSTDAGVCHHCPSRACRWVRAPATSSAASSSAVPSSTRLPASPPERGPRPQSRPGR